MKSVCLNCGKEYEFEPKKGTFKFKYCSHKCKEEFIEKDNKPQFRICENCGKEYWWDNTLNTYEGKIKVNTKKYCCYECGKTHIYEKAKQSTIKKYGAIGFGVKELREKGLNTTLNKYGNSTYNNREKAKQTCLDKYGTKSAIENKEIKEKVKKAWNIKSKEEIKVIINKRKNTSLERYGTESPSQNKEIKEKIKENWNTKSKKEIKTITNKRKNTCLNNYNVTSYAKTDKFKKDIKEIWKNKSKEEIQEILNKREETCLKKYGETHFMKSEKFIEEYKQNMIQKFGIEYPYHSILAQKNKKETCLKKWGTEYSVTNPNIRKKIKDTCLEKYGVENPFFSKELREKGKKTCLEHYGVEYGCISKPCIEASTTIISKTNIKFYEMLKALGINTTLEFSLNKYSYDLKVDNILIEINPTITHSSSAKEYLPLNKFSSKESDYHLNKTLLAEDNGYRCIHIWDWDSPYKIAQILKPKIIIGARKLKIKEVSKEEANNFLDQYHLQNSCNNQEVRFGLYKEAELIEIMTFGKPRYNKKYEWELLRLCTKSEYKVIGGAERLFKHFIRVYNPKSIISYCDNAKFTGNVYTRLGMILKDKGKPSKHWFNIFTNKHITDNLLRQRGYSQLHKDTKHKKGESNELLMLDAGYLEIYDCGQSTYEWFNY